MDLGELAELCYLPSLIQSLTRCVLNAVGLGCTELTGERVNFDGSCAPCIALISLGPEGKTGPPWQRTVKQIYHVSKTKGSLKMPRLLMKSTRMLLSTSVLVFFSDLSK